MNDIINFNLNKKQVEKSFSEFSEIGEIFYPLKTNSNIEVIKLLKELFEGSNNGFLISHFSHYDKLISLGINPNSMCQINVLMDDGTIKRLFEKGVRYFTFDNIQSLKNFGEYADFSNVRVAIRLSISEVFEIFSHLGARTSECIEMFTYLKEKQCDDYGVSFYLQKETIKEVNALDIILEHIKTNFKDLGITFVDIGGSKRPKEIDRDLLENLKQELNINKIILEPGRYFIGDAVEMEIRIIKVKTIFEKPVVILKNGIYGGLVDVLIYNKKFDFYLNTPDGEIKLQYEKSADSTYEFMMCGGSSDSGDRLGLFYINEKYAQLLKVGATLLVKNAGGYVEEFFMPLGGDLIKNYYIV